MASRELGPIDVSGLKLETPVMNGAGPVKVLDDVKEVARSGASAVLIGSITVEQRQGNEGITYFVDPKDRFAINSRGLPNPGSAFYKDRLPDWVKLVHSYDKPLIVSVAGFSPEEYAKLSEIILESGADGQELNLGCPNVWGKDGKQKRIASFDEDLTGETLRRVEESVGISGWTSVKLSPFSDPMTLIRVASVISRSRIVKAVTTTNTFPNAFAFANSPRAFSGNEKDIAIEPAGGLGGMSGSALKPIGLGQVRQLREILPQAIAIIGVGGISSIYDIDDYLKAGATATQITTAYINLGPSVFKIDS